MEVLSDTIKIDIVGDSSGAVSGIEKLISTLEKLKGTTSGGSNGLNALQKNLNKLAEAVNSINSSAISKLADIANGITSLKNLGSMNNLKKIANGLLDIGVAVELLKNVDMSNLTELSNKLSTLKNLGVIKLQTAGAKGGEESKASESIKDSADKATSATNRLQSAFKNMKTTAQKAFSTVSKAAGTMKNAFTSAFSGIISKFQNLTRIIKRRVMYRAINAVISAVTKAFQDGIKWVYEYSQSIDGTFAKSMDTLSTSFNYLKASVGAMISPLITLVTPYIDKFVDKFVEVLNVINQVFARLSGSDTWTKAIKVPTEYASATDKATKANKGFKKSLMGFDELNVLTGNKGTSGGASSDSEAAKYKFEEVAFDNATLEKVDELIDKLKKAKNLIIGLGIAWEGLKFASKLANLTPNLSGLEKLSLAAGVTLTVAGLTLIVDGLVDIVANGINWENFLEEIGGAGAVVAGGALIGNAFGAAAIGAAIAAVVSGLALYFIGIWDAIKEGLNLLNGMLITVGATLAGAGIGALIGGPIGAAIGAAIGLWIAKWTVFVIYIKQHWEQISSFFTEKLELIKNKFSGAWNFITGVWGKAKAWFTELFTSIWNTVSDVFYNIRVIVSGCWKLIKIAWEGASRWFDEHIFTPIKKIASDLWKGIKEKLDEIMPTIQNILNSVKKAVKSFINGIIKLINKFISGWFSGLNAVGGFLKNFKIGDIQPFKDLKEVSVPQIPLLANGGGVPSGQMFIAREAGAELVGNIGRQTAVMNNEQIVDAVSQGVYSAVREAMSGNSNDGNIAVYVSFEGGSFDDAVVNAFARKTARSGGRI